MPPWQPSVADILHLLTIPKIGPGRLRRLLSTFRSVAEIERLSARRLMQVNGIDATMAAHIRGGGDAAAVALQLRRMAKHHVQTVTIWDEAYPPLLKNTADPPALLFYRGTLPAPWPPAIGVVGTRSPTSYGRMVTERLCGELLQQGIMVVSGLARGIDTMAHRTMVRGGGLTAAVLGCGADQVYPRENAALFEAIVSSGVIFSEYFLGTQPDAVNFPRRNRIISGMTSGTLIVEADVKSGALITAGYALDQNREVFAVPGNITSPRSRGPNQLIQQGAKLVTGIEDVLEELQPMLARPAPLQHALPLVPLSADEQQLLELLSATPQHVDQLMQSSGESPAVLLSRLLSLELKGVVRQLAGKMFIRI